VATWSSPRGPVGDERSDREADPADEDRSRVVEDDAEPARERESNQERGSDDHAMTSIAQPRERCERDLKIF
jgi:hypothetical protein